MSVFERKIISKIHLDDTEILVPSIINSELRDGHTEYVIRVQRGFSSDNRWYIHRRYNDFLALHHAIQDAGLPLPFPPKKYIGNLDRKFISERQSALQVYLDEVLKNPFISTTYALKRFLDPINYKPISEDNLVNELQIGMRNEADVKIVKQLPQLGWRFRKKAYLVTLKENKKKEFLLEWVPFGPDKYLEDEELHAVLKTFISMQHVNIAKVEKAGIHRGGGWTLHEIKCGTLLDVICGVKDPLGACVLKKYANFNNWKPLNHSEVIEVSSQILQALAFLHHKGIPYGHLHLGNILLDSNVVKLYGTENTLFGLPSFHRQSLISLKSIDSMQAMDVYCFGLTMFEMLFAKTFDITTKEISLECPPALRNVLESILTSKAIKNGFPTVKDLLNLQIFRRTPPNPQPYFKITQCVRDNLDFISNKIVSRIKDDYNKVREGKKAKTMQRLLTENDPTLSLSRPAN